MDILLAIIGWLITWFVILGVATGVSMLFNPLICGIGVFRFAIFIIGIIVAAMFIGYFVPDEGPQWTVAYRETLSFYLTTLKGWFLLIIGLLGWKVCHKTYLEDKR